MRYEAVINGKRVEATLSDRNLVFDDERGWSARVVLTIPTGVAFAPTDVNQHQEECEALEVSVDYLTSLGFTPTGAPHDRH